MSKRRTRTDRRHDQVARLQAQVTLLRHVSAALVRTLGGDVILDSDTMIACEDGHMDLELTAERGVVLRYREPERSRVIVPGHLEPIRGLVRRS